MNQIWWESDGKRSNGRNGPPKASRNFTDFRLYCGPNRFNKRPIGLFHPTFCAILLTYNAAPVIATTNHRDPRQNLPLHPQIARHQPLSKTPPTPLKIPSSPAWANHSELSWQIKSWFPGFQCVPIKPTEVGMEVGGCGGGVNSIARRISLGIISSQCHFTSTPHRCHPGFTSVSLRIYNVATKRFFRHSMAFKWPQVKEGMESSNIN